MNNMFDESTYFVEDEEIVVTKTEQKTTKIVSSIDEDKMKTMNTSTKIRFLNEYGWSRSEIKNYLGIRYQHVRGVLETPLKKKIV